MIKEWWDKKSQREKDNLKATALVFGSAALISGLAFIIGKSCGESDAEYRMTNLINPDFPIDRFESKVYDNGIVQIQLSQVSGNGINTIPTSIISGKADDIVPALEKTIEVIASKTSNVVVPE